MSRQDAARELRARGHHRLVALPDGSLWSLPVGCRTGCLDPELVVEIGALVPADEVELAREHRLIGFDLRSFV